MKKEPNSVELRFKYKFDDNYNPVYANGVYGGIGPCGEVIMHFYQERNAVPHEQVESITIETGEKKEIVEKRKPEGNNLLIRFVENGVVMNELAARSLHTWLGEKINQIEKLRKQQIKKG